MCLIMESGALRIPAFQAKFRLEFNRNARTQLVPYLGIIFATNNGVYEHCIHEQHAVTEFGTLLIIELSLPFLEFPLKNLFRILIYNYLIIYSLDKCRRVFSSALKVLYSSFTAIKNRIFYFV